MIFKNNSFDNLKIVLVPMSILANWGSCLVDLPDALTELSKRILVYFRKWRILMKDPRSYAKFAVC